jgi:hypothetical protein
MARETVRHRKRKCSNCPAQNNRRHASPQNTTDLRPGQRAARGRAVRGRLLARLMPGSAIITLQLGQCGNQLGHELFATLAREAAAGARGGGAAGPAATGPATGPAAGSGEAAVDQLLPQFFRCGSQRDGDAASGLEGGLVDDMAAPPVARSVLVDMEPKVIWQVVERASRSVAPGRWRYQPGGSYAQASGAGNNWAYGFAVHGPAASDSVMELVRKEAVRKTTFFESFSLYQNDHFTKTGSGETQEKLRQQSVLCRSTATGWAASCSYRASPAAPGLESARISRRNCAMTTPTQTFSITLSGRTNPGR